MLRRIGSVLIGIVAAGVMLLQFEVVRSVGVSLLASAGIVGILVGFAAQRTLGGIISGIEISLTQPLRIGDIVTFDGSEGTVERIYFTYVVMRLADDRRLIVPVSTVMSKAFENLSLMGQDLLVVVDIFLDFTAPIDLVRAEFERLCKEASEWDGRRAWRSSWPTSRTKA
jgi:small-conductance mechanosensitive channel